MAARSPAAYLGLLLLSSKKLVSSAGGLEKVKALRVWIRGDFNSDQAEAGTFDYSDPQYASLSTQNQLRVTLCP